MADRVPAIGHHRLMALTGHATVLLVEDVRRATDYYRDALGFDVELYDRIPDHYGYARRDGCHVHFARFDGVAPRPNSDVVPPDMFDAYFWVDDVDRLYADVVEREAEVVHGPVNQGYGLREFRVRDPEGYILAFGQPLDG
jgi:predicted enzyme related to lactoylglutathione lyase